MKPSHSRSVPSRRTCTTAIAVSALLAAAPVSADLVTEAPRVMSVGYTLADDQAVPVGFEIPVADSAIRSVTRVEVGLFLRGADGVGGFASEMFVSLSRVVDVGGSTEVRTANLLNGVGIRLGDPIGQGYDGWNATFADDAAGGDIHGVTLLDGILNGAFQPDGRVLSTDSERPLTLAVFEGRDGNGLWRLNVADLELGGQMRLESWSLTLTGETAVPEPSTWAAVVLMSAGVAGRWLSARRRRRG